VAQEIRRVAERFEELFAQELSFPEENLQVARAVAIRPKAIRWFDGKPAPAGEPAKEDVLCELPAHLRPKALGYFHFSGLTRAVNPTASYSFFLKESSLVRERPLRKQGAAIDNLRYVVVPSVNAPPNPGLPLNAPVGRAPWQASEGMQVL